MGHSKFDRVTRDIIANRNEKERPITIYKWHFRKNISNLAATYSNALVGATAP